MRNAEPRYQLKEFSFISWLTSPSGISIVNSLVSLALVSMVDPPAVSILTAVICPGGRDILSSMPALFTSKLMNNYFSHSVGEFF